MTTDQTTRPARPSVQAILVRALISLALLAVSALAFRFTLLPVPEGAASRGLVQREAVAGATRADISLDGGWADLNLKTTAQTAWALNGQLRVPPSATVQHQTTRQDAVLRTRYQVRGKDGLMPLRFQLGAGGLNVTHGEHPLGVWMLTVSQHLPTALHLSTTSGDQQLYLGSVRLSDLRVSSTSGEISATIPNGFTGRAHFETSSGDLTVASEGSQAATADSAFTSQSTSGEQTLNLEDSAFRSVQARSTLGDLTVRLPARLGLSAALTTDTGEQYVTVPVGLNSGTLNLHSRIGDMTLLVPSGAAVRILVSTRVGETEMPPGYLRQGDTYSSPAARTAPAALKITVSSFSGILTVREAAR
ncbi:DUF4097 family beta strand repeat-containing protein (plasmid) [Deinococcus sp. KNUC1210]|uniref:DUF4097 family beta strand repeat-containing protein n=1 Tax=Deinococcus sp. KNUC1210 TaxID=2917691 RepID=UPI001EF0736D|nr:DUF4097 family beta strand repeat-containing protein [Deinococcus sp. KNUC1210]ULH18327.1 DUF4097 family beta strand repeat-containing protein [Deinococcus sp. KNUC1210]